MNVFIARIAAAAAAAVIGWGASVLGMPVTEAQTAGAIAWLTEGLTGLGGFVLLLVYGIAHKLISRVTNPADAAKEPQEAAAAMHIAPAKKL